MQTLIAHSGTRLLARRISASSADGKPAGQDRGPHGEQTANRSKRQGRGLRPTRGPFGEVRWWERPSPGGHEALWDAVQRLQRRRLQLGVSVTHLAQRLTRLGHPISRETLSRVLNGKQPTSWATVEVMAEALSIDLPEVPDEHS